MCGCLVFCQIQFVDDIGGRKTIIEYLFAENEIVQNAKIVFKHIPCGGNYIETHVPCSKIEM